MSSAICSDEPAVLIVEMALVKRQKRSASNGLKNKLKCSIQICMWSRSRWHCTGRNEVLEGIRTTVFLPIIYCVYIHTYLYILEINLIKEKNNCLDV